MATAAPADWVRPRCWLVGSAAVVGVPLGPVAAALLAVAGDGVAGGTRTAFAAGSLVFGFGLLGWSGSVFAGRGVEAMQRHLDTGSDWTEADSRRAMARTVGFGAGLMIGASALAAIV